MDMLLLQALRNRKDFVQLRDAVPREGFDTTTTSLLDWFKVYFEHYKDSNRVEVPALLTLLRLKANATPEQMAIYGQMLHRLDDPVPANQLKGIVDLLVGVDFAGRAAALTARYQAGEEVDLVFELNQLSREATRRLSNGSGNQWIDTDIGTLLESMTDDTGIQWRRFPPLMQNLRGLRGGDNVALCARPDAGKSSLVSWLAADFAPQVEQFFGDRPILWLINEGPASRQVPRAYQAALNCSFTDLYDKLHKGTLKEEYTRAIGGRFDRLRLKDAHGLSIGQVHRLVHDMRPAMLITDMTAHLRCDAGAGSETARLEELWKRLREIACEEDLIHIGTAQVSIEGANMLYPPQPALKDSKTAIQSTLDLQINMGNLNDPKLTLLRGFGVVKNKMPRAGKPSHIEFESFFDPGNCAFNIGGV